MLLLGFLYGFALIVASSLLKIDRFLTPNYAPFVDAPHTARQVGYIPALNWSLTYFLLLPNALYLMLTSLGTTVDALDALHSRGMVRNSELQAVRDRTITKSWIAGTVRRRLLLLTFGVILPVTISMGEWFRNNLLRLFHHGPTALAPDYDWGLKGIMCNWSAPHSLLNASFDFCAFCCEGVLYSSILTYFLLLLDLGRVLPHRNEEGSLRLFPDLRSDDPRRGFEIFSDLLQQMLIVVLLAYLMCYLVRLEGAYMDSSGVPNLATFVQGDILTGAKQAFGESKDVFSLLSYLFDQGHASTRSFLAWTGSILVFTFSLVVVLMTVRVAAQCARSNAIQHYAQPGANSLCGGTVLEEQERLKTMVAWPLGYLRANVLLNAMVFAVMTLYWYRIGLFVFGMVLGALLLRVAAGISKWGKA